MLSDEVLEKVVERLTNRIEQGNTYVLEQIGKSIKKIGTLSPSKAQQLVQIMRYGGDYDKIVKKLAQITELNVKDIYSIFEEVAKSDYQFAKQFYDYREKKFIPYEENKALQNQVRALATQTASEYVNLSNTLAFTKIVNGRVVYTPLARAYQEALDKAVLSISQGKTTFQEQLYQTIKELASSGIKTVNYDSGRSIRLDSAVRMQMKGALRNLHNELQSQFGQEFGSNGVEISVHSNPAPDHQEAQGRQFSKEEWKNLQSIGVANDIKGKEINMHLERKKTESVAISFRPISSYNCQHWKFDIVLGVSEPEYSDKELQQIIDDNNKGFDFDGKHYTNYEGTQLQRRLETEIRKQKDTQMMAKASGNNMLAGESQNKISILTKKYKQLSDISGLPTKMQRMRVSNYKRSARSTKIYQNEINKLKVGTFDVTKFTNEIIPTTNDVILIPKQEYHIKERHPEIIKYLNKLPTIINNPDKIYMELNKKRKNTIWLTKEIDGNNLKISIKINTTSLYQKKELGYKNSIIQMQILPQKRINNKIKKNEIKELFDIKSKK